MNLRKYLYLALITALLTGLISGCSTIKGYGKLGFPQTTEPKMTLDQLVENWKDYDIYYSGVWEGYVYGVMFDPKNDDRKLVGHEWWAPVQTQEDLAQMIRLINSFPFEPQLWKILSPDNRLHGFIYTFRHPVMIKVIDDRTLWVDELTFPPIFIAGDPMEENNL
ncbi:MAG: hypothetical protein PVH82_03280 [Desulfobacteraceae bacterium]|jgi:hypothetical protein